LAQVVSSNQRLDASQAFAPPSLAMYPMKLKRRMYLLLKLYDINEKFEPLFPARGQNVGATGPQRLRAWGPRGYNEPGLTLPASHDLPDLARWSRCRERARLAPYGTLIAEGGGHGSDDR
jgi:hypothetical protein